MTLFCKIRVSYMSYLILQEHASTATSRRVCVVMDGTILKGVMTNGALETDPGTEEEITLLPIVSSKRARLT